MMKATKTPWDLKETQRRDVEQITRHKLSFYVSVVLVAGGALLGVNISTLTLPDSSTASIILSISGGILGLLYCLWHNKDADEVHS